METSRLPKFSENFAKLRGDMSQAQFAEKLGISRATVGLYENGSRLPDALVLRNIAKKCGVSTDYLVGLVPEPTNKIDMRAMCEYTGLSSETLSLIHRIYAFTSPHHIFALDDFLRIYAKEIYYGLTEVRNNANTASSLLKKLEGLGAFSEEISAAEFPFYYANFISEHFDAEQTETALQKSKSSQIDDELFEEAESVAQKLELSIFRLSKTAGNFADIYNADDILTKLRATLRNQELYRINTEMGEMWADVLSGKFECTAKGFDGTGESSDAEYEELRFTLPPDTAPFSARNIPSTAVEAQSDTLGGDPSPIEERQDGRHKEDKR